jgi:hypothetical protein
MMEVERQLAMNRTSPFLAALLTNLSAAKIDGVDVKSSKFSRRIPKKIPRNMIKVSETNWWKGRS